MANFFCSERDDVIRGGGSLSHSVPTPIPSQFVRIHTWPLVPCHMCEENSNIQGICYHEQDLAAVNRVSLFRSPFLCSLVWSGPGSRVPVRLHPGPFHRKSLPLSKKNLFLKKAREIKKSPHTEEHANAVW